MTNSSLQILEDVAQSQGCLIYSRGGTVPYLTPDNFEKIFQNLHTVWYVPLSTVYEQPGMEVMKLYGKSFNCFANLDKCTLMFNVNDSSYVKTDLYKYNEEKSISIWAPSGRRKVTPEEYMNVLDVFGTNICVPPSDTIPGGTANKRCQKSCDRTVRFLDKCLEIKREKNLDIPVFGVLEGGSNVGYRQKCAKEIAKRDVDGYVFNGFDIVGDNWKDVLNSTLEYLPDKKLKIMFGLFTPVEIIQAVQLGMNLFDTAICCYLTEQGHALDFQFKKNEIATSEFSVTSAPNKKLKHETNGNSQKDFSDFVKNLHNDIYTEDMKPLVEGCECYCCIRYTRAYLHHLLVTKEMLAEVLLMMHNLHHWTSFIQHTKTCERNGELEDLLKLFN